MKTRQAIKKVTKILVIGFLFFAKTAIAQNKDDRPNFLFILVDDLGKEWVSSYGATEISTPNIDKLAKKGIKFNNAYSMPQCTPSRVALTTGEYPYANGWINHYDVPRWGHGVNFDADKNPSFAKELQQAGYKTCVAGKWQINDFRIEPNAMKKAGFDEYCMWTGYESGNKPSDKRYWDPYIYTNGEESKTYEGKFGPDIFSDFVIDFMKDNKKEPFCVYYPMVLTHSPFVHTPLEPNVKSKLDKHKAMVNYTDFIIEKIMKSLKENDLLENTFVFFTTDNGTSPSIIGKRNGMYIRGGKAYLTENGINSPFIVKTPKNVSKETDALIDFTDIYPTLLDLAGVKPKTKYELTGTSFADVLLDKTNQSQKKWILSMGGLPAGITKEGRIKNAFTYRDRVLRNENYKVYVDSLQQIIRLYDLKKDPYEQSNVIANQDYAKVLNEFKTYVDELPAKDANARYTKTHGLPTDVNPDFLNNAVKRARNRKNNMMGLATEEQFLKLKNK